MVARSIAVERGWADFDKGSDAVRMDIPIVHGSPGARLSRRTTLRLSRTAPVTFAVAALRPHCAAVAADSLQLSLPAQGTVTRSQVRKTLSGQSRIAVVAGYPDIGGIAIRPALVALVNSPNNLHEDIIALHKVVDVMFTPWVAYFCATEPDQSVLLDVVVFELLKGLRHGMRLRVIRAGNELTALVNIYEAGASVVVDLGVQHPLLTRASSEYAEDFPGATLAARMTRIDLPEAPLPLPTSRAKLLKACRKLVKEAVASESLAQRPHRLVGTGMPVAAGPVTFAAL